MDQEEVSGTAQEKRLYELIWKRTIASQMADAELERTTISIKVSNSAELFLATGEVIKFDGFLRVYLESTDNEDEGSDSKTLLPPVKTNQILRAELIDATERFTQKPPLV